LSVANHSYVEKAAQHSVHLTLGILGQSQAVFYASAFSQSDGVPPPAPAQVTQTVGLLDEILVARMFSEPFQKITIVTISSDTTFWWEALNK
jgi:hypothetical protein